MPQDVNYVVGSHGWHTHTYSPMLHSANDARENVLVENGYTTTIVEMRKIWLISATK